MQKNTYTVGMSIGLVLAVASIVLLIAWRQPEGQDSALLSRTDGPENDFDALVRQHARQMVHEGRQIFRFDTFGSEAFWGDTLKLHRAIGRLSPLAALELGLKVDVQALPDSLVRQLRRG